MDWDAEGAPDRNVLAHEGVLSQRDPLLYDLDDRRLSLEDSFSRIINCSGIYVRNREGIVMSGTPNAIRCCARTKVM